MTNHDAPETGGKELSTSDEIALGGAALRGAPWKTATLVGGGVGAGSFLLDVILPGPASLPWSLTIAAGLFFLTAAIGAISKPGHDRTTAQARAWATRHPWRFGLVPAAASAAVIYPIKVIFGAGIFWGAISTLWPAFLVYVVAGVLTTILARRAS